MDGAEKTVRETRADYAQATYADVLAAPEHLVAELIDGALHTQPRPRMRRGRATMKLAAALGGAFDRPGGETGPGGWFLVVEPELHLGAQVLAPDIAGWRRERAPTDPDLVGVTTPPDWVCEVLSPTTRKLDETRKSDIYAEQGVGHLWLVDPEPRLLTAFALSEGRWTRLGAWCDAAEAAIPPFDAVALSLSPLWMDPPAEPRAGGAE